MKQHTLLGFDYGEWKIGIAVGQTLTKTATGLTVLKSHNRKPNWSAIETLLKEWQPTACVVGVPLTLEGERLPMTDAAERFARQLHGRFHLPVYSADERLSSREASNLVGSDKNIDDIAAQIILQQWLEENSDSL